MTIMQKRLIAALFINIVFGAILTVVVKETHFPQHITSGQTGRTLRGQGALGDWTTDAPGVRRRITLADLPKPFATESVDNGPKLVERPPNAWPQVPAGFKVEEFLTGLDNPRLIRTAPNGDMFLAESQPGRIRVLRAANGGTRPEVNEVFVSGLNATLWNCVLPVGAGSAIRLRRQHRCCPEVSLSQWRSESARQR